MEKIILIILALIGVTTIKATITVTNVNVTNIASLNGSYTLDLDVVFHCLIARGILANESNGVFRRLDDPRKPYAGFAAKWNKQGPPDLGETAQFWSDAATGLIGGTISAVVAAPIVLEEAIAPVLTSAYEGSVTILANVLVRTGYGGATAGAAGISILLNLGKKLDFVFGQSGGTNLQRSTDMLRNLNRIGISNNPAGRALMRGNLNSVFNSFSGVVQSNGNILRQSLLMGPKGGVQVNSIWNGQNLVTVILKGGPKR